MVRALQGLAAGVRQLRREASVPLVVLAVMIGLCAGARPVRAESCPIRCPALACQLEAARCLLAAKRPDEAKDLLKSLLAAHPEDVTLSLLLAKSYLVQGNIPWTRRVLAQAKQAEPSSCQVRSWSIWIAIKTAELEQAQEELDQPGCPDSELTRGRWALLRGTLARYRQQPEAARRAAASSLAAAQLYEEDLALLDDLLSASAPALGAPPLRLRLELGGGYTSNGMMSSPVDLAATVEETGSPLLTLDLFAGFDYTRWWARPLLELSARGALLTAERVSDFSYLSLGLRSGVGLGALRLYYAGQLFLLEGGDVYSPDGPRWFYETHRAEAELEPFGWLSLWAGAGRAVFREQIRTRSELDGGAAVATSWQRMRLLTGLSLRRHWATQRPYDLWGGMALASATYPLGQLSARARVLLSFDHYNNSAGYFAAEARRDLLLRAGAELWSPARRGLRLGISYELSDRLTNAESYGYVDHRGLLRLSFSVELDPWRPKSVAEGPQHVALPYGVSRQADGSLEDERIQDILRQEDAARRGSSCVN